jgi:aspartate/methionine/tyrosine aminotransferase
LSVAFRCICPHRREQLFARSRCHRQRHLEEGQAHLHQLPNNPTAATAPRSFYEKLIEKAKEFGVIVVHDAAYTEIYFDEANKPLSILEIPGGKDVAIEFHSLSKTYNMTGWRIGMAVGNASLVKGLAKIKNRWIPASSRPCRRLEWWPWPKGTSSVTACAPFTKNVAMW